MVWFVEAQSFITMKSPAKALSGAVCIVTAWTFCFFACIALAQDEKDPVTKLTSQYEQALDLASDPLKKLGASYVTQLGKLKQQVQQQGNLKLALKVETEIQSYEKEGRRDFADNKELLRLRDIYESNRTRLEKEVAAKQVDILRQAGTKFGELSKSLTQAGDLVAAVRSEEMRQTVAEKLRTLEGAAVDEDLEEEKFRAVVSAENNEVEPFETKVELKKGQKYRLIPNPRDEWSGGGSQTDVFCDYKGYPGQKNQWMKMFSRIGGAGKAIPVEPENILTAESDGVLQLYAGDGSPAGNKGEIRVTILVNPELEDER